MADARITGERRQAQAGGQASFPLPRPLVRSGLRRARADIDTLYREQAAGVLATLIRRLGDFELAEESRQEAFAAALEQWPTEGIPENPRGWLIRVARHKAIDRIRRDIRFREKLIELEASEPFHSDSSFEDEADFGDDRLRLIFTCCHPALNVDAQVALTLRTVCGLTTPEVARAFLVAEETMAQRLVRAQRKIRDAGIPFETPAPAQLDARIEGVLSAVYLVFSEGYAVTSGINLIREDLCREAIRLGRLLDTLLADRAAIQGLLALMLLHDSRRKGRLTSEGDIVLLADQDRSQWNQAQIEEGLIHLDRALHHTGWVSPYTVQAAIAALHARAAHHKQTDWRQIVGLYKVLLNKQSTPVIQLNHAAAVSMVDGPARALELVESLSAKEAFTDDSLLNAVRADLLRQLGRREEALEAYRQARLTVRQAPERRLIERRIAELE